jgi:RimJ/RimL family protein N-acetyltransferase
MTTTLLRPTIIRDIVEIRLTTVENDHIGVFYEHQADPLANEMADFPSRDREAHDSHWAKILAEPANTALTVLADGEVAGNVVAWGAPDRMIGYWIGRDYWGRGIATEAVRLLISDVETTRPLHAEVVAHNKGSRRVLEKCRFTLAPEPASDGALAYILT